MLEKIIDSLKPNYDDFYKFLVSTGLIFLVISISFTFIYTNGIFNDVFKIKFNQKTVESFGVIYSLSLSFIIFGLSMWFIRQRIYDKILVLDFELKNEEIKFNTLLIKKLEKDLNEHTKDKKKMSPLLKSYVSYHSLTDNEEAYFRFSGRLPHYLKIVKEEAEAQKDGKTTRK